MPTIARISRAKCSCGFDREMCFYAEDHWQRPCPDCGKPMTAGGGTTERTYGNRRFAGTGSQSVAQGCHPADVKDLQKRMPKTGHCIQSDGSVSFPDSRTEQAYRREMAQVVPDSAKSLRELGIRP